VRVYHKPLVNWIWGGALLMAIGGAFAVTDRRYALHARKQSEKTETIKPDVSKAATVAPGVAE
jgi:cytochrome c-type biogenesis protein CcmF